MLYISKYFVMEHEFASCWINVGNKCLEGIQVYVKRLHSPSSSCYQSFFLFLILNFRSLFTHRVASDSRRAPAVDCQCESVLLGILTLQKWPQSRPGPWAGSNAMPGVKIHVRRIEGVWNQDYRHIFYPYCDTLYDVYRTFLWRILGQNCFLGRKHLDH